MLASSADPAVQAFADRVVRSHLETTSAVADYFVARYAEDRMYQTERASDDLLAIIRYVIAAPPGSGREILAYVLTNPRALREGSQRDTLLQEFIDRPDDSEAIRLTARSLFRQLVDDPLHSNTRALLKRTLARMDGASADLVLLQEASTQIDKRFADVLADLLTTSALKPPGGLQSSSRRWLKPERSRREPFGRSLRFR